MGAAPAELVLRQVRPEDVPALLRLFRETVRAVCRRDYTPVQLDAWIGGADPAAWAGTLAAHDAWAALLDGRLAGFADMDAAGYLDRLYVHRAFQRRGVATALCDHLEARCAAPRFVTHASITARPFFERRGYELVRSQIVTRNGVELKNFVLKKERQPR